MEIDRKELVKLALEARQRAYAPYSNYQVGAALLGAGGKIYTGCNIENAVYPECICAERVAIFKAVSEGVRSFRAIAVATRDGGSPCGACRQVMNEFSPEMLVIIVDESGRVSEEGGGVSTAGNLLPFHFGPSNLK